MTRQDSVLADILTTLGSGQPLEPLLAEAARALSGILTLTSCAMYSIDDVTSTLRRRALAGQVPEAVRAFLDRALAPEADLGLPADGLDTAVVLTPGDQQTLPGCPDWAARGVGWVMIFPMVHRGRLIGCVLALGEDGQTAPSTDQIQTSQMILRAVTPLVELARIEEAARRVEAERRAIRRTVAALLETPDLGLALQKVCREAAEMTGASGSAVLLLDDANEIQVAASLGDGGNGADRILREVMAASDATDPLPVEPVLLDDFGLRPDAASGVLIQSIIAVPLVVQGQGIGVLQLVNPAHGYQTTQLGAIKTLADRLAVMIAHVRLLQQHQQALVIEERHRLARELHDSVTQAIYGVTVLAEAGTRHLLAGRTTEAAAALRDLRDAARTALREMRVLIFEMHPLNLEKMDLIDALRGRLSAVESRAGLKTELHCEGAAPIPDSVKGDLYRIAQEALNNSVNHARASRVTVRLVPSLDTVRLEVVDDGVGFELESGRSKGGLGLKGMEERVAALGGSMEIVTRPGEGTRVRVDIPVRRERSE